ncbi:hypothetical protein DRP05_07345, partial [Archaeoglobales archaeon]
MYGMGFSIRRVIVVLLLLALVIGLVSAQPQILGKWDYGAAFDITASGNYLFVGAGEQVRIYDIS